MADVWNREGEVVAWTEHDGPARPDAVPTSRRSTVLAGAWTGWFAVALVGCAVLHEAGSDHLDLPAWQDALGIACVLLVPLAIGLLARDVRAGAWLSAGLGVAACLYSATQVAVLPWWTVVEAGGFLVLGMLGLELALRRPPHVAVEPDAPEQPAPSAPERTTVSV